MPALATLPTASAILAMLALAAPARATEDDGFVMGAGGWSCADVVQIVDGGSESEIGQITGWLLGYWSAATFARETGFVDTVEQVGGRAIFDATVAECRKAPGNTLLYVVTRSMIKNTK
jgi:hypothetical protein